MQDLTIETEDCVVSLHTLKHLKIEVLNAEYTVILCDLEGQPMLKGYGKSVAEALNDLHHNLI